MNPATKHIRHGVGSVRPYLYGRLDMLELVDAPSAQSNWSTSKPAKASTSRRKSATR